MKNLKPWAFFIAFGSIFFFYGCVAEIGYYNPGPQLAQGSISEAGDIKSVCLINDQEDKTRHVLAFQKIEVDYHAFTQSLIDALSSELKQHGVAVEDTSDKKLFIKVSLIDMRNLGAVYRAKIKTIVTMGDGKKKMILSTRSSYGSPFNMSTFPTKPLDAAFSDLPNKIWTSSKIQTYLKGK